MANEATQKQFNDFFKKAVEEAENPDPRVILKKKREQKALTIKKKFGF